MAQLAVWFSGHVLLPISPTSPASDIEYYLETADCSLCLVHPDLATQVDHLKTFNILIDPPPKKEKKAISVEISLDEKGKINSINFQRNQSLEINSSNQQEYRRDNVSKGKFHRKIDDNEKCRQEGCPTEW